MNLKRMSFCRFCSESIYSVRVKWDDNSDNYIIIILLAECKIYSYRVHVSLTQNIINIPVLPADDQLSYDFDKFH